jgi:hypothetical protein
MITSNRNVFTAFHVEQEIKDAIRAAADKEGITMSEWIYRVVVQSLEKEPSVLRR